MKPDEAVMKKENSKLGIISIALAVTGLIAIGIFVDDPNMILLGTPQIIGIVLGAIGLFQKTKSRLFPIIGIVLNFVVIVYVILLIYALMNMELSIGYGAL